MGYLLDILLAWLSTITVHNESWRLRLAKRVPQCLQSVVHPASHEWGLTALLGPEYFVLNDAPALRTISKVLQPSILRHEIFYA